LRIYKYINKKDNILIKGVASTLIKMAGAIFSYALTYLIAIKYGAEGNGLFAIFMTYTLILSTFFYMGMDFFLIKKVSVLMNESRNKDIKKLYLTILKSYILLISIFIAVMGFTLKTVLDQHIILIISIAIIFNVFIDINSAVFRGMKKAEWFSFFSQCSKYFIAVLLLLIPLSNFDNDEILYLYLISLFLNCIFSFLVLKYHLNIIIPQSKPLLAQKVSILSIFKNSKEFFFSSIFIILLVWMDFILIDLFLDEKQAGIYSVALKLATLISFGFTAFNAFLAPKISEIYSQNNFEKLQKILTQNFILVFPMIILPFIGILFFNKELLLLFGPEFESGGLVLILLSMGYLINGVFGPVSLLLQMTNYQKLFQNILVITLGLKILLSLVLVKRWGLEGIALASFIGLGFWTVIGSYFVYKKMRIYSWFNPAEFKGTFMQIFK
jgi:O-antigen/teichoic acid export membrane protein